MSVARHVLVTGAGGFLGRYLVEQLVEQGDRVRVFSRQRYPELDRLGVDSRQGDLRNAAAIAAACEGIETVYHAAGVAGIWGPWSHYHGINTVGTMNVVAACRRHRVSRLVHTSSPSVTFDGTDQSGVDETVPYPRRWLCHYPHSKALAEQHVLAANGRDDLMTCALRPHLIWGPRDEHLIPRLLDRARQGLLRRVGDGSNRIDMIHVANAAQAHLQAAAAMRPGAAVCGRAYFLSQGAPVNCWDWINDILGLAGLSPVSKSISFRAAWHVGAALETVYRLTGRTDEPRMTRFLAAQLAKDHYYDIARARHDFGYTPVVTIDEGMRGLATSMKRRP